VLCTRINFRQFSRSTKAKERQCRQKRSSNI